MDWQSIVVAVIAVVVVAVIIRKTWRLFTCRNASACTGCTKECDHRK